MLAAAAMAFGLYAEGEAVNKTDFSGLASGSSLNVLADDNGQTGTGNTRFWTYTSETVADDALLIKNDATETPVATENYLSFKTGSETIYRNFNAQNSSSEKKTDFSTAKTIPATGLYSDTTIKFGAPADELAVVADAKFLASVIDETAAAEGIDALTGKATNLWVIGGCYEGDSLVNRAFRMEVRKNNGDPDPIDDEWLTANKRFVIKAYENVGNDLPGFILYVGNNFAAVKGWAPVLEGGSIDFANYTAVTAADYLGDKTKITQTYRYGLKQLLLPLATGGALTAVGFKGTGALDSIKLSETAPTDIDFTDAVEMKITIDENFDTDSAKYTIGGVTKPLVAGENAIEFAPGSDITVTVTYTGKIVKWSLKDASGSTSDVTPTSGNSYTIEKAAGSEELTIKAYDPVCMAYDASGNPLGNFGGGFESIVEALKATGVAKVVLVSDEIVAANTVVEIGSGKTITLDFAGKTITGNGNMLKKATINNLGNLTITNSTDTIGKIIPTETGVVAVQNNGNATLNVQAGIFDGDVVQKASTTGDITATAGSFKKSTAMTKAAVEAFIDTATYRVVEDGDYWKVELIPPVTTFSVKAAAAVTHSTLSVTTNTVPLAPSEGDIYTANKGDTIVVKYTADTGYEFAQGATTEGSFTTDDDTTFATAPAVKAITYNITFTSQDGTTAPQAMTYTVDRQFPLALPDATTELESIEFKGWTNETYTSAIKAIPERPATLGDIALVAQWDAVAPTPIDPDPEKPTEIEAENQADAEAKAANMPVGGMPTVEGLDQTKWNGYFDKTVTEGSDAKHWNVTATLKEEIVKAEAATTAVAAKLGDIAAAPEGDVNVAITGAKPGLWYSLYEGSKLDNTRAEGDREMADKDGKVTLKATHYEGSGFYQVQVNVADK